MTNKLLFVLVFLLPEIVYADTQHYPFKLAFRAEQGNQVIIAQNNGPAPILATVNLTNSENAVVDHESPIVVVVKPHEDVRVATVHSAVPGQRFRIGTQYKYALGVPDVTQDPVVTYRLPFQAGQQVKIGQVIGGHLTTHHSPDTQNAIDFDVPVGTPIVAARKGRVIDIDQGYTQGGNNPALKANHILILHEDGTLGMYSHLKTNSVTVSIGDEVAAGALIGYSGNTGYSTGPHLHFAVLTNSRTDDGSAKYIALPTSFVNGESATQIHFTQFETLVVKSSSPLAQH